jgi:hypothetical protein
MRNVRMIHEVIPAYQIAKRARLDQLAREAQTDERHAMEMLALVLLCGTLVTFVLLVASIQLGWWG